LIDRLIDYFAYSFINSCLFSLPFIHCFTCLDDVFVILSFTFDLFFLQYSTAFAEHSSNESAA